MIVIFSIILVLFSIIFSTHRNYKKASVILLVLAFFLSAFNTDNIDYGAYLYRFNSEEGEHEWLWNLLAIPAHKMGMSFVVFRILITFFCFSVIHWSVKRNCIRPDTYYYLYLIYPFALDVVQTRNFIVMSILIAAFPFLVVRNLKNRLCFILVMIIAAGFQSVAYIYIPLAFVDLLLDKISVKKQLCGLAVILLVLNYLVGSYVNQFLGFIVNNYGNIDSRIGNIGNTGLSGIGYLMYWLFHACGAIYVYWAIKYDDRMTKSYMFFKTLLTAQIYISLTLPFIVFDSTFERFSRNLIPLIFLGIAMSNKKIFSKNYIFGNKLKGVLFVGYILVMCWMDIINGYMDTIVMPLFNNNLFNI